MAGNKKWAEETLKRDPSIFEKTATGQAPPYLYIGCSDSRVPAASILGCEPGEVFVHRNIGN
jgi:carbonic anhydrase